MIRTALTLILAATAAVIAWKTADTLRERPVTDSGSYVLRAADGNVAVYDRLDPRRPLTVTEIELDSLRAHDRALIEQGLPADSREELMALLEDLGD